MTPKRHVLSLIFLLKYFTDLNSLLQFDGADESYDVQSRLRVVDVHKRTCFATRVEFTERFTRLIKTL